MNSSNSLTVGERMVRIETVLGNIEKRLESLEKHITSVETSHKSTDADYQRLKNRAWGLLAGVATIGGAVGAGLRDLFT